MLRVSLLRVGVLRVRVRVRVSLLRVSPFEG